MNARENLPKLAVLVALFLAADGLAGCASAENEQRRSPPGATPDTGAIDPGSTTDSSAEDTSAAPTLDPGTQESDARRPTPDPGPPTPDPGPPSPDPGPPTPDPGPPTPDVPVAPCDTVATSTLPGVAIEITTSSCVWSLEEAAAGLKVGYQVEIDEEVTGIVSLPQDAGYCGQPDETGLILFPRVDGDGHIWCICDTGLCAGPDETPKPLQAGTYPSVFEWDGREFQGPSDTGFKPGEPFPPGVYTLSLRAIGRWEDAPEGARSFEVKTTFLVNLVP